MSKDAPEFSPQKNSNGKGYTPGSSSRKNSSNGKQKIFKRKESNDQQHKYFAKDSQCDYDSLSLRQPDDN